MEHPIYICVLLHSPLPLLHMVHIRIRELSMGAHLKNQELCASAQRLLQIPTTSFEGVWT